MIGPCMIRWARHTQPDRNLPPMAAQGLHPGVKIAEDPNRSSNHDEQDEPGKQNQLEIFPLLPFERKV